MKLFLFVLAGLGIVGTILFFTSCEEGNRLIKKINGESQVEEERPQFTEVDEYYASATIKRFYD